MKLKLVIGWIAFSGTILTFLMLGIWGDFFVAHREASYTRVLSVFSLASVTTLFLWMGAHCLASSSLRFKPLWILAFVVGNMATSAVYFIAIYLPLMRNSP
jgi:hypothetical protein